MTKISQLSDIGGNLAANDEFIIRDVSDASTPNKKVTASGFFNVATALGFTGLDTIVAGVTNEAKVQVFASGISGRADTTISGVIPARTTISGYFENASGTVGGTFFPVVTQTDIGTAPNQVPLNGFLGTMAFQNSAGVNIDQATINTATVGTLTVTNADTTIFGVAVGRGAGAVSNNTALGSGALNANITGGETTALGYRALYVNTTGTQNTAVGSLALTSNTTGQYNTALGVAALNTSNGSNNTAVGRISLYFNTSGGNNTGVGLQSLYNNSTGSNNVCVGYTAGTSLTTGSNNTIIGSISGTAGLANTVIIGAGSTERLRIDSGGVTSITAGIKFPATQVASADPNTLDDYEEGTWTPTQGANLTVVGTFSSTGRYLKVGRQVFLEGVVTGSTSVAVSTTNAIAIGGLPFTSGYSRTPGLAGNEAISASATFQLVGTTLYFMQTMAATTNIRFVVTYSI